MDVMHTGPLIGKTWEGGKKYTISGDAATAVDLSHS